MHSRRLKLNNASVVANPQSASSSTMLRNELEFGEILRFEDEGEFSFFAYSKKIDTPENSIVLFSSEKLAQSFLLKEVKPFRLDPEIMKFLTADTLFPPLRHFRQNLFEDEIWLKVFSRILKKLTPRKALLYFWFTR